MMRQDSTQNDGHRTLRERWQDLRGWPGTWNLFRTVGVMIFICLVALAVAWWLWGLWAKITTPNTRSTVSLATVGGLGGLVALVVAYRKQAMSERNEVDGKLVDAVHLLGEEKPSTRIAGVYALANVGDRYPDRRQQIIDILCGYLRTKRKDDGPTESTIIAALKSKLSKALWTKNHNIDLDLHDATITEVLDLRDIKIHFLVFNGATFNGGVWFDNAEFTVATFTGATFNGGAEFGNTRFGNAEFNNATFNGFAQFGNAEFDKAKLNTGATFNNKTFFGTTFIGTTFNGDVWFDNATFNGFTEFGNAEFNGDPLFSGATFNGDVWFNGATFNDKTITEDIQKDATFKCLPSFADIKFEDETDGYE